MCSIKIQTENFCENTNASPILPIGNASALWASRGVHNNIIIIMLQNNTLHSPEWSHQMFSKLNLWNIQEVVFVFNKTFIFFQVISLTSVTKNFWTDFFTVTVIWNTFFIWPVIQRWHDWGKILKIISSPQIIVI